MVSDAAHRTVTSSRGITLDVSRADFNLLRLIKHYALLCQCISSEKCIIGVQCGVSSHPPVHKVSVNSSRLRGDLIEVFKILKGYENIDREMFFDMSQSNLRGHSLKLNKKRVRLDVAKFSFSNRVVNEWNILDDEIISGCSLPGFKRKLDRHLRDKRGYI